jgi:hypothetical protein
MTFQLTTAQALKSFAGAAVFGLGLDLASLVSCQLTQVLWLAVRQVVGLLFWSVLNGVLATHTQILGHDLFILGCPLQVLHSLGSLAHFLGAAV